MRKTLILDAVIVLSITMMVTGCEGSRIELPDKVVVEDYHQFYDTTAGNTGGSYREDDVDIEVSIGSGSG